MSFHGKTILERVDSSNYILKSELSYENDNIKVTALPGTVTDGASIPKWAWSIIGCPLSGRYVGSAIIHDVLCKQKILTRLEGDKLFLEMMKDNKVPTVQRYLMFFGIRIWAYVKGLDVPKDDIFQKGYMVQSGTLRVEKKNV